MNTPIDFEQHRTAFEHQCFAYFESIKRGGWSNPEEGDSTPAALFWRREDGRYGVHQIEAAWQGFKFAVVAYAPVERQNELHLEYKNLSKAVVAALVEALKHDRGSPEQVQFISSAMERMQAFLKNTEGEP